MTLMASHCVLLPVTENVQHVLLHVHILCAVTSSVTVLSVTVVLVLCVPILYVDCIPLPESLYSMRFFNKFSSNVHMNGRNDRVRAHAKQCLLRRPWPLPSDREIPGYWENLESKV